MSIIIRGMKMPKNCDECPCYYETEGAWRNECEVLGKEYIADDYRPEWCPLVELPAKHGRLIDADALYDRWFRTDDVYKTVAYKFVDKVELSNATTIIEEEKKGAIMNNWIPTSEKMPKAEYGESDSVLTIDTMGEQKVLYFDGGNWCLPTGECLTTARKFPITHWMPLPEPPEEVSE